MNEFQNNYTVSKKPDQKKEYKLYDFVKAELGGNLK